MPKRAPRLLRVGKTAAPPKDQKTKVKKAAAAKAITAYNNRAITRYPTK